MCVWLVVSRGRLRRLESWCVVGAEPASVWWWVGVLGAAVWGLPTVLFPMVGEVSGVVMMAGAVCCGALRLGGCTVLGGG